MEPLTEAPNRKHMTSNIARWAVQGLCQPSDIDIGMKPVTVQSSNPLPISSSEVGVDRGIMHPLPALSDYEYPHNADSQLRKFMNDVQLQLHEMRAQTNASIRSLRMELLAEISRQTRDTVAPVEANRGHSSKDENLESTFSKMKADLLSELRVELAGNGSANGSAGKISEKLEEDELTVEAYESVREQKAMQHLQQNPEYKFEASVWDLSMFIGLPELGQLGSLVTALLYLINSVIQCLFCIMCNLAFTSTVFGEESLGGMRDFRSTIAHDHLFYDRVLGESLATRICDQTLDIDEKINRLENANHQLSMLDTIEAYLSSGGGWWQQRFAGQMMVVMALSCWCLTVFEQVRDTVQCLHAVASIKHGRRTTITCREGEVMIHTITPYRFGFMLMIITQKLAIGGALLFSGSKWLAQTPDIQNLLLNVVALEVIFRIDDLLFETLATHPNKQFIEKLVPVKEMGHILWRGLDLTAAVLLAIIPATVVFFYIAYVVPMVDDMVEARDLLCKFDTQWTYGLDNTFGMLWVQENLHSVREHSWGAMPDTDTPFLGAAKRLKDLTRNSVSLKAAGKPPITEVQLPLPGGEIHTIGEIVSLPFEEMVTHLNPNCVDILDKDWAKGFRTWLQVLIDDESVDTCQQVKSLGLCKGLNQPYRAMRLLCSHTCGCDDAYGEMYSQEAFFGCAPRCTKNAFYSELLNTLSPDCSDMSGLINQPFWQSMSNGLRHTALNASKPVVAAIAVNMSTQGCLFLEHIVNITSSVGLEDICYGMDTRLCMQREVIELCQGTSPFHMRPLSPFCPTACSCATSDPQSTCAPICSNR